MSHSNAGRQARQIEILRAQFAQKGGLPFAAVLPEERIERAMQEEGATWRQCVYSPLLTLWAFLSQVASPDGSCRATVARVLAWLVSRDERPCSAETDPYCKARQRLPEPLFHRLVRETGQKLHEQSKEEWRWQGRRVRVADGTTVSMPDTPENQAEYPQASTQQKGVGFPIARLVVVFCLACGAALNAAIAPYRGKKTGENTLLRGMEQALASGDVLLVDRYFGGFFDIALQKQRGIDVVVPLHQLRQCDMRRGRRLGRDDHVVKWPKPARPEWMDEATYASLADELELREVRVRVAQPGIRTKVIVVVTTLLDADEYSAADLAELYRMRWHVELDLRSLKISLGMDVLRCKSPAMVRKEIWAHLLVYNLIRTVMAQAAAKYELAPRQLSFKGALQIMLAFAERLLDADARMIEEFHEALLAAVAAQRVGDRPDRVEPRAVKRRPKSYPLLTQPRGVARKQLLPKG